METKQGQELREFSSSYKELDDLYHSIAWKHGLSDSAFEILYTICVLGDGCSQKDICEWAYVSKKTINSSIRRLKEENYIFMEHGTGRTMHIHLTEKGRQAVRGKIEPVIRMENEAFRKMGQEQSKEMLRLIRIYVENFREEALKFLEQEEKE